MRITKMRFCCSWSVLGLAASIVRESWLVSRMVQLADFVAWATYRRYESGNTLFFDQIFSRFDAEGSRIHGPHHRTSFSCNVPLRCLIKPKRT
jgi:hypothetical protein